MIDVLLGLLPSGSFQRSMPEPLLINILHKSLESLVRSFSKVLVTESNRDYNVLDQENKPPSQYNLNN